MKASVTVELLRNSGFRLFGHHDISDLNPKELLLYSAATCAGKTVSGILSKMEISPDSFAITVSGELNTDKMAAQSIYTSFDFTYRIHCRSISDQAKVSRAINLTNEKYCGLIRMLRKIAPVSFKIAIAETVAAKA